MLTRTIVFIGFGLTDPDFLHIIGKIKNEFKHNPRDHFAIVADVSNIERDYWFLNYGIQILSYETLHTENGRDYSSLLPLLRSLITKNKKNLQKAFPQKLQRKGAWITSNQKLKLERYARYLIQQFKTPGDIVFPLMLKRYKADGSYFDHVSSLDVQNTTSQSFILTGNPGAGKTFFLRQYCTKIAEKLQKWCINPKENTFPKIPIYIDLKGYSGKGTLRTMIESQLPEGIPIMDWIENNKIILLLDSFNEVDKKFLDNHACLHELKKYNYENTVVIASRFKEPLDNLYLPEYHLLEIEKDYVGEFLEQRGYTMPDRNQEEFFAHFQKPLFFNLLKQGKLTFYSDPNPISPLWSYFNYLNTAFNDSFEYCLVWEDVFQELAYNLCKKGTERFRVVELYELLAVKMIKNDSYEFDADVIINWLIESQYFMAPISMQDLSFFHQSITEFLAARYLAIQYEQDKTILNEQLLSARWDYVLLYVPVFLDKEHTVSYFDTLLQIDSILAIRASAYLKHSLEQIVATILWRLISCALQASWDYWMELAEHFREIPVMPVHEPLLRKLMACKDIIGGLAAEGLLRACKYNVKAELLEEMFSNLSIQDYNYSEQLGAALSDYITLEEYKQILVRLGDVEIEFEENEKGLSYGFDTLAQNFQLDDIIAIFKSLNQLNTLQRNIFIDILSNDQSQEAFDQCLDLIKNGFAEAVCPAFSLAEYHSKNFQFSKVDGVFLSYLSNMLEDDNLKQDHKWVINLIYTLYQKCPQFAKEVRASLKCSDGIVRLTYLYTIGKNRKKSFRSLYGEMLYFNKLPFDLIGVFDEFDWAEYADNIIANLLDQQRLGALAEFVDGNLNNKDILYEPSLSVFIKLISNVISVDSFTDRPDDVAYDKYRIGMFIAQYLRKDDLLAFYHTANKEAQCFFNLYVLNRMEDLTLKNFTPLELAFMIENLRVYRYVEDVSFDDEILLANIADKEFITSTLMPLFAEDNAVLQNNVHRILEKAGEKQGTRYISR
ncbi:MAG: SIR2 family protein [Desulfobacterales bacterium]|nr:SIR2 family protein [Desulfobacterales bacterium]